MRQRQRSYIANNTNDEAIKLRRVKAIELRVEGKLSMRAIANELGVSPATIYKDLAAVIREECEGVADLVKTAREVEAQRLDLWTAKCMAMLDAASDCEDQVKILSQLTRISERRAKLMGLDAPIKQEIDATIGSAPRTAASARAMMQAMFASSQDAALAAAEDEPVSN